MSCVKPLLLENSDDDYPYTLIGTCFVIQQQEELYVVTARHCLQDERMEPEDKLPPENIRVPYYTKSGEWLRFSKLAFTDRNQENEGLVDLAVFKVAQDVLNPKMVKDIHPFPILGSRSNCLLSTSRGRLVFAGHPFSNNELDYDSQVFSFQCCWGKAQYLRASEAHGCHTMLLTNTGFIHELNGLSGSPVFQLIEGHNKNGFISLAGVILRGTIASHLVHFVDASHIYPILDTLRNPR